MTAINLFQDGSGNPLTIDWGFTATDIFTNGMNLVKSVGPYVLLGIAVMFVPKLVGIIRSAVSARNSAK